MLLHSVKNAGCDRGSIFLFTWITVAIIAVLALVLCVGGGDVALTIIVVTFRVDGALGGFTVIVDAREAGGAVGAGAGAVRVRAALRSWVHLITDNIGAVHIAGPVTHRTIGILITHIKHQGPPPLTLPIFTDRVLTICTLNQAGFSFRTALPEFAAI